MPYKYKPRQMKKESAGLTLPSGLVVRYVIWDEEQRKPYIDRAWTSEPRAKRELQDLLKPYPAGHPWRVRLSIRPWYEPEVRSESSS